MAKGWLSSLLLKLEKKQGLDGQREGGEVPDRKLTTDEYENCKLIQDTLRSPVDLVIETVNGEQRGPRLVYLRTLVNAEMMQRHVLRPLQGLALKGGPWNKMASVVAIDEKLIIETLADALNWLHEGWTLVAAPGQHGFIGFNTPQAVGRGIDKAENQSIVIGPQDAFSESLETNFALIRKRLKSPMLRTEMFRIGTLTQTSVAMVYLADITNEDYLGQMRKRIQEVSIDGLLDSGTLGQLINDQPLSPFPQFNFAERPDSAVAGLMGGKIVVLVDGTPYVLIGPSIFIEFFHSPEDYFNRWASVSLLRLLRVFGVMVSITLSAIYVAILTYHYEIIPANMLKTVALSRAKVPFPPLYEALFLELTLEVLREAGARLPTKVGQTMGIVGGIVIGQAAVSAGMTSNVMIIVVSLSALASFVTPSYAMGNAVRVIRFPMILLAGMWGLIGLFTGLVTTLLHLLNLSSLGAPYMAPFAPLRLADLKDTLIRVPTQLLAFRPSFAKTKKDKSGEIKSLQRK